MTRATYIPTWQIIDYVCLYVRLTRGILIYFYDLNLVGPCPGGNKSYSTCRRDYRNRPPRISGADQLQTPRRTTLATMKLEGCQVVIKCGGVSMREFSQEVDEDGNIISCYIASQPGKASDIQLSTNGEPDGNNTTAGILY